MGSSAGRIIGLAEECVGVIVGQLPTGTVTLVFTGIEGSTRMLRALGAVDGGPPGLRGVLRYWSGAFATRQGRAAEAADAYREAVELFRAVDEDATRVVRLLAGAAAIRGAAGAPLGDHQRSQLSRRLEPASAALGRDVLALAAEDVAEGRALTFDQLLDYAAAWADQRRGPT
jgi:hypothetical protein